MPTTTSNLGTLLGAEPQQNLAGGLSEGVKAGIQLATAADTIESDKMKVQEQKIELAQKQATAMLNRTKAAMFAQSPAAFDSIMKANKAYADSIGLPYNDEALKAAYKDPTLRLSAQREINRVMSGGQLENPQAIVDFFGSDSPAIFEQLQNASYQAGVKKQGQDFEMKKQAAQIQGQKDIAAMQFRKADVKEAKDIAKENRAETKKLNEDLASVDKALQDMKDIKESLSKYSASSVGGTGPIATGAGLSKYLSQKTEALDAKFKKASMDQMVQMFAGMSKAIDTGAERRAFEATQPSLSQDDATNMQIIEDRVKALEALKAKIKNAQSGVPYKEISTGLENLETAERAYVNKAMTKGATLEQALAIIAKKKQGK